jgi:hypothetical protein
VEHLQRLRLHVYRLAADTQLVPELVELAPSEAPDMT